MSTDRLTAPNPGPISTGYRFTNAYRASDRVSQYLIRNVIYDGLQDVEEVFFRTLLFKIFNRVDTWELLTRRLGESPSWRHFQIAKYERIFDQAMSKGQRLYSAAYMMPSPPFGEKRKHANHLQLLDRMMRDGAPRRVATATSLKSIYDLLLSYPSLGGFLAFQTASEFARSDRDSAFSCRVRLSAPRLLSSSISVAERIAHRERLTRKRRNSRTPNDA